MSFLGIDIGSSRVKAVAFSEAGRELGSASRGYPVSSPEPGFAELDGEEVMRAAFDVIGAAASAARSGGDPVRALAISSQGEAFLPVDSAGKVLAPAMISSDTRATDIMAEFAAGFGIERLYRITGHTASGMFTLAKLLWLAKFRPEIRREAKRFLCFEDLLVSRLGAEPAMGWPLAGRTMLFDVETHRWSRELCDATGFSPEEFARPLPSGTVAGTVSSRVADALGLEPGTLIVSGGHDQALAALGCGACFPGGAMYAAGSVECIAPVHSRLIRSAELFRSNLCCYDFALPGRYLSVAYSLTGSNFMQYFLEEFCRDLGGDYAALAGSMPTEPTSIDVLPYFTASGTPYFDTRTPGTVHGWRLTTTRGELFKAVEEGIAMEMRRNLELLTASGFQVEVLVASGGGCRLPALVQLRADVLNLPFRVIASGEAGCRGAALLARSALCGVPVEKLPGFLPEVTAELHPEPRRAARYQEKFEQWKHFTETVRREL